MAILEALLNQFDEIKYISESTPILILDNAYGVYLLCLKEN